MSGRLLPFAQLDLPGELELADGRYLVRPAGDESADPDVLAVRTLGAPRASRRLRRRKPEAVTAEPEPTPLPMSRLTMIKAAPFENEKSAADWLERVSGDDELARGLADEVARTFNRAIVAHRVAAPDAYASEINAARAVAVRFGYGSGEEVSNGHWSDARELQEGQRRSLRREIVDGVGAQERIAAVLGGRDEIEPAEDLLLAAERATSERRGPIAAILLAAGVEAAARRGVDTSEADAATAALKERALSGGEIDPEALRAALRAFRRAVRAGVSAGP